MTGQRAQTISAIKVSEIKFGVNIQMPIRQVLKTSKVGKDIPILLLTPYKLNNKLCVVSALNCYLEKTKLLRKTDNLWISFTKPHGEITTQTLSRWLTLALKLADIDCTKFRGHSYRHVSTSRAMNKGVSADVIYKNAGWSERSKVFAKYYNKPLDNSDAFANAIIN